MVSSVIHFNPIIVLFLTKTSHTYYIVNIIFQSYYSLIFNLMWTHMNCILLLNFNPIIVLFLTFTDRNA